MCILVLDDVVPTKLEKERMVVSNIGRGGWVVQGGTEVFVDLLQRRLQYVLLFLLIVVRYEHLEELLVVPIVHVLKKARREVGARLMFRMITLNMTNYRTFRDGSRCTMRACISRDIRKTSQSHLNTGGSRGQLFKDVTVDKCFFVQM